MKAELQKAQLKKLLHIVEAPCRSAVSPPVAPIPACASSPSGLDVAPYALWQQLPEVKMQNLLHTLAPRDIRHQEVSFYYGHLSVVITKVYTESLFLAQAMFELIVSEASYQKSLRVAVRLFQSSAQLKQTLTPVQSHVLFSNLKEVCKVSER